MWILHRFTSTLFCNCLVCDCLWVQRVCQMYLYLIYISLLLITNKTALYSWDEKTRNKLRSCSSYFDLNVLWRSSNNNSTQINTPFCFHRIVFRCQNRTLNCMCIMFISANDTLACRLIIIDCYCDLSLSPAQISAAFWPFLAHIVYIQLACLHALNLIIKPLLSLGLFAAPGQYIKSGIVVSALNPNMLREKQRLQRANENVYISSFWALILYIFSAILRYIPLVFFA